MRGIWSAHAFAPLDAEGIGGLGLVAGLVVAAAAQPLVTRLLRGRSTSHRDMLATRVASFIGVPALVVASLLFANGALDRSPEVEHHAVVVSLVHGIEYRKPAAVTRTHTRPEEYVNEGV